MRSYLRCSIAISFALSIVSVTLASQNSDPNVARDPTLRVHSSKPLPKTVEVGLLGGEVRVSLIVGDTLRVVLPVHPLADSTGSSSAPRWRIVSADNHILQSQSNQTLPPGSVGGQGSQAGAVQNESLSFLAKAPGKIDLKLEERNGERTHTSSRKDVIAVRVHDAANSSTIHPEPVVVPTGKRIATYRGNLPCADCSGIRTRITLYATGARHGGGGYYVRTMTYLDAPHGDSTFVEAGRWSVRNERPGKSTLPNDKPGVSRVIDSFHSNTSAHQDQYEDRGNTLVPLASDGKPIQSPFNMDLYRQP